MDRWMEYFQTRFPVTEEDTASWMSLLIQPLVNSLMISSDNRETEPGGRTYMQTNQLQAYERIEHSHPSCGSFQEIADMLGVLVFTSLAALGNNCLWHLHPNKHTLTSPIKGGNLRPDSNALILCAPHAQCWLRPNPCLLRIKMSRLVVRWPPQLLALAGTAAFRTRRTAVAPAEAGLYLPGVDHQSCIQEDWWGGLVKESMVCAGGGDDSGCHVSPSDTFNEWTWKRFSSFMVAQ